MEKEKTEGITLRFFVPNASRLSIGRVGKRLLRRLFSSAAHNEPKRNVGAAVPIPPPMMVRLMLFVFDSLASVIAQDAALGLHRQIVAAVDARMRSPVAGNRVAGTECTELFLRPAVRAAGARPDAAVRAAAPLLLEVTGGSPSAGFCGGSGGACPTCTPNLCVRSSPASRRAFGCLSSFRAVEDTRIYPYRIGITAFLFPCVCLLHFLSYLLASFLILSYCARIYALFSKKGLTIYAM